MDSYKEEDAPVGKKLTVRCATATTAAGAQGHPARSRSRDAGLQGLDDIAAVQGGIGVSIVSTSDGLLTDREARRRKVGGEILAEVW